MSEDRRFFFILYHLNILGHIVLRLIPIMKRSCWSILAKKDKVGWGAWAWVCSWLLSSLKIWNYKKFFQTILDRNFGILSNLWGKFGSKNASHKSATNQNMGHTQTMSRGRGRGSWKCLHICLHRSKPSNIAILNIR